MVNRNDLRELRQVIEEARVILTTTAIPDGRAARAKELVSKALTMTDGLIARPTIADAAKARRAGR
jgi:hypothetical protein